jgi:iron complex outermembrane receptor protein
MFAPSLLRNRRAILVATACASALVGVAPAHAQQAKQAPQAQAGGAQLGEIIVTARKRQESILNVPVIETAIPQVTLQRFQTQDLKDISKMVPGLMLGENVLSIGATVSLRGVGTTSSDPGVDASVSLNVDGLQLSNGLAYRSAIFDIGQVEVLKGPQALFYGKSSPGGVISLRTADPTDHFEMIARAGYEFEAAEKLGEFIVSGPITDTLKGRLAAQYDSQDGFFDNIATAPQPGTGGRAASEAHISPSTGYTIRGTLLWNPTSQFDARFKLTQDRRRTLYAGTLQVADCPEGVGPLPTGLQFMNPNDNCKLDRQLALIDMDPRFYPGLPNEGTPYLETTQSYGTLELNYHVRPDLTVTSTTGYYLLHSTSLLNTSMSGFAGPIFGVTNGFHRREWTEELRANSDFAGPLNFTAGAFFQRGNVTDDVVLIGNSALGLPPRLVNGVSELGIKANSVFAQLRWKIIPQVELAAGGRWTGETRSDTATNLLTGQPTLLQDPNGAPGDLVRTPEINSSNFSPEISLTYKPTEDVTVFANLKRAFKSGSFSIATPPNKGDDPSFGDEKVNGGEIGLKSRWLDRRLSFDISAYKYRYSGLQVGAIIPVEATIPVVRTINAGSSLIYGIEGDVNYLPEMIEGLGLHATVNWNHAQFKSLDNVPCYGGQTVEAGCTEVPSPFVNATAIPPGGFTPTNQPGGFTAQNQSGLPLVRAPRWESSFGFDYEHDIGNDMKLVVANSTQYSSKFLTGLGRVYYQPSFFKTDLSLTIQGPKDRWEFALIGKNLNNAITSANCENFNDQGGLLPGTEITGRSVKGTPPYGTPAVGPAGIDEIGCFTDRGREIWLRVTFKPFS